MALLTVRQAAARLGVSYPTLKQWIYKGSVRTTRTAGGHHRVAEAEIERLLAQVRLRIGDQYLTAVITRDAVDELRLRRGDDAVAVIKATEVMVARAG